MKFLPRSFTILLALCLIEGCAWWWMHPTRAEDESPILTYQPPSNSDFPITQETNLQSLISPSSSFTPLPEIYEKSAPILRCTSGQVFYYKLQESVGLHGAFFEWNGTNTGSVLEAFRHMPEACMGAIGLKLISKEKPIPYKIDGYTLFFDHTIFRDPSRSRAPLAPAPLVHTFRAVWVSGDASNDFHQEVNNNVFIRLRAIRLKSALTRFRPKYARVIQGAVHGIPNAELAWQAFEQSMLVDLKFKRP